MITSEVELSSSTYDYILNDELPSKNTASMQRKCASGVWKRKNFGEVMVQRTGCRLRTRVRVISSARIRSRPIGSAVLNPIGTMLKIACHAVHAAQFNMSAHVACAFS